MTIDRCEAAATLPAAMADIFLALIGVIILMLLALLPVMHASGVLQALKPFEVWRSEIVIDGRPAEVLVAEKKGLRIVAAEERLIPLDAILNDGGLASRMKRVSAHGEDTVLFILPDGQEAAFLFTALSGQLGLERFHHVRLDRDCKYVHDPSLAQRCRRHPLQEGSS